MIWFLRRIQYWWRRDQLARELAEEIELHRQLHQERLENDGRAPGEAVAESRRRMGNVTLAREASREAWSGPTLDSLAQDSTYAARQLRRQPGFALLAIATLALGIGLNTSVFTIYSALALRPWPVADPGRVVSLFSLSSRDLRQRAGGAPGGFSLDEAAFFTSHARTLSGVVATRSGGGNQRLSSDDAAISWVSGTYFGVLGVPMALGRGFTPGEDRLSQPSAVAVLSHRYWTRAFGADPSIVGRAVRFDDVAFTVVGVTAADFSGTLPDRVDIWMPIASAALLRPADRWAQNIALKPGNCCLSLAARLAPGATREEAAAELTVLDARYRAARSIASPDDRVRVTGTEFMADAKNDASGELLAMFAGVALVLLLGCANVGNLLIARALVRRREIAVRLAMGASRARVMRQLVTEGLVLALAAGSAALWFTLWLPRALVTLIFPTAALQLTPDRTVLAFGLGVTLVSCLLFALAPAAHATRGAIAGALQDGAPHVSARLRLRSVLLGLQVAAVVVLLASAGLLFRAVAAASARDFGYDIHALSVASVEAPARGYEAARTAAVTADLVATLDGEPHRSRIAFISTPPMGSGNIKGAYRLSGANEEFFNGVYEVSPSYFAVAGVPIVAGRALDARDAGRPAIVINETMARRHWSVTSAVGQRVVSTPPESGWNMPGELEIVGVARDAYMAGLTAVDATIYQPVSGRTLPHAIFRSADGDAAAVVTAAANRLDARLRIRVRALAENLTPRLRGSKMAALLASLLGAVAVVIATVGLFGMFAFSVQQRTHEIGIRIALGARSVDVAGVIAAGHAVPLAAGLAAGALGSFWSARVLRGYLMGFSAADPLAYAGVAIVLTAAAAVAMYLPARRAMRIDPLLALRHD